MSAQKENAKRLGLAHKNISISSGKHSTTKAQRGLYKYAGAAEDAGTKSLSCPPCKMHVFLTLSIIGTVVAPAINAFILRRLDRTKYKTRKGNMFTRLNARVESRHPTQLLIVLVQLLNVKERNHAC